MSQFHFRPDDYLDLMHSEMPDYERLQTEVARAAQGLASVHRVLELGTGTGETSRRVLAHYPRARLMGVDVSKEMLAAARRILPAERVDDLLASGIEEPLPSGPFDLVISALTVHHLDAAGKADLFERVARVLRPGGRFVLGDVVVPTNGAEAVTPLSPGYDLPDSTGDLLRWLGQADLEARITWASKDLAVLAADRAF